MPHRKRIHIPGFPGAHTQGETLDGIAKVYNLDYYPG